MAVSLSATRRVLRLAGADVLHFLQGLTTNDVTRLAPPAPSSPPSSIPPPPSLYSAFLTPQGRIISDVFFHREETDDERESRSRRSSGGRASTSSSTSSASPPPPPPPRPCSLFAEVDASVAPQVLSLLRRYRLRAQVDIDDVESDFEVVVDGFGGGGAHEESREGNVIIAGAPSPPPPPTSSLWPRDPRGVAQLGRRAVLPRGSSSSSHSSSRHSSLSSSPSPSSYASARYALGIAEGAELEPGRGTPLEANLDALGGVSFSKGCYVGQELVARAHFRGQVHKRVMPVELSLAPAAAAAASAAAVGGGSDKNTCFSSSMVGKDLVVVDGDERSKSSPAATKKKPIRSAGRLLAICAESGRGIALVRLSSVFGRGGGGGGGGGGRGGGAEAQQQRQRSGPLFPTLALASSDGGDGVDVEDDNKPRLLFSPSRPGWWPDDWGYE